jgi:hypothetical protein
VFGHCLRAAMIVRADAVAARPALAASVAAIEAGCPHIDDHVRRHAAAARAWLDSDPALALERYGAIVGLISRVFWWRSAQRTSRQAGSIGG